MDTTLTDRYISEESRWQALSQRDAQAAGAFFYAVSTTGIYCRPGCRSRLPRRENVRFFTDWQAAERAGFRPCKRCQPRQALSPNFAAQAVQRACQQIEASERAPSLQELADKAGLSRYYFHRLFKQIVGLTPKEYAAARRDERLRAQLPQAASVAEAAYGAGFESSSRFYAAAKTSLGMTPSAYRQGGAAQIIRYALAPCDLGWVLVAATPAGICRIDLHDSAEVLKKRLEAAFPSASLLAGEGDFQETLHQVVQLLETPSRGLSLPLDIQGTAFQRRVWAALRAIPAGTTLSYAQLAAAVGNPRAVRAVAQACAANPLAVAIPCHRARRKDGGLGGYRWGLERKRTLIELESPPRRALVPKP
jgi:AraC family transcriptional regulator of adaptative response/methylated-DNA-[protein]-cysteine methyltransferase